MKTHPESNKRSLLLACLPATHKEDQKAIRNLSCMIELHGPDRLAEFEFARRPSP